MRPQVRPNLRAIIEQIHWRAGFVQVRVYPPAIVSPQSKSSNGFPVAAPDRWDAIARARRAVKGYLRCVFHNLPASLSLSISRYDSNSATASRFVWNMALGPRIPRIGPQVHREP